MSSVISVPANEGIGVKNENDLEINAMALKLKETFQKNVTSLRLLGTTAANVYINRAGIPVPLNAATISSPNSSIKSIPKKSIDSEDLSSIEGKFGWKKIGTHYVPYIVRVINKEQFLFVSVRVAETGLLSNYLHYLHADIYTKCTSVRSHFMTESEAKLLNDIYQIHDDLIYGKKPFIAGKDYIVHLKDVLEFCMFIKVCFKRLFNKFTSGCKQKCGFIRINSVSIVPYYIIDDRKYVPLFYFEGDTENLRHQALKLENWDLAYLKFCCKVQGIRDELYASDSYMVASLDDIKTYFPPDTNFEEEYWPTYFIDQQLFINRGSCNFNPSGCWIKTPCTILNPKQPVPENIVHLMPPLQSVAPPPSMPMGICSYQNECPSNQMVNSYITQAQPPPPSCGYSAPSRNLNIAAQYYNANSAVLQQNNNSNLMNIQPPPLVQTYIPTTLTQVISNNVGSYQNVAPMSQSITTMYNSTEIIDMSSLPSNPGPQTSASQPEVDSHVSTSWDLKKIAERQCMAQSPPIAAYKIQKKSLQGEIIHCINAKPFMYSDLMVTLDDLVQAVFPNSSVARCANILTKYLSTTLYRGNSEQIAVMRKNGLIRSDYADKTPMVRLQDIMLVLMQLKALLMKPENQISQFDLSAHGPTKRQRSSLE